MKASDKLEKAIATESDINTNSCRLLLIRSRLIATSQVQNARQAGFYFQYIVQSSLENGRHKDDSKRHSAVASRPGVIVNVAVEGQVHLVGKEQIIKGVLKGGGIAAWVLRPSLHPPPQRLQCNIYIDINPEGSRVQNIQALWKVFQRMQYTA